MLLDHDAWAAVGSFLDPVSLTHLSCTCTALHADISSNNALWRRQAQKRWPALFPGTVSSHLNAVQDWAAAYRAAHRSSCQLASQQPWSASIPTIHPAPRSAQLLLLLHSLHSCSSGGGSSSGSPALAWHTATCIAAALPGQLHFWRWGAQADVDPPFVGRQHSLSCTSDAPSQDPYASTSSGSAAAAALEGTETAAALARSAGEAAQHWHSDTSHGHTAPVTVMLQLPTGDALAPGFATGSQDTTIKLWTPFSSSSSSSSTRGTPPSCSIRPVRTLSGHTDRVTALACCRTAQSHSSNSSSSVSSDGGGSGAACAPLLVSGSADKTIRLWSLASIWQAPPATSSSSSRSSSSSGASSVVRQGGQHKAQQAARNPLLGTLRGHSAAVTSLLQWPAAPASTSTSDSSSSSSTSSSSNSGSDFGILSSSRDGRVKLWDVCEGRRCCSTTWRLPGPCRQLLSGLDMSGCAVVMVDSGLQVLDTRVVSAGSAVTQGVISLPWGSHGLATAAVHGNTVAAGGREGVRAWDLRMPHNADGGSSSGGGGSSCSSRLLLAGSLSSKAPVTHVQLDSLKLVAASNRTKLHSAAGIAVWSLPAGDRVDLQSSCLSGISLQPDCKPYRAACCALGCSFPAAHAAMQRLIDQLSDRQAEEAADIRSGEQQVDGAGSDSESEHGEEHSSSLLASAAGAVAGLSIEDEQVHHAGSGSISSSMGAGCVEPGVLALAVQGPVVACVDSLGNLLLRDFTAGVPGPAVLQSHAAPRAGDEQREAAEQQLAQLRFWRQ